MATNNYNLIKMTDSGEILFVSAIKNNEDFGSISYDLEYEVYDYKTLLALSSKGQITAEELKSAKRLSNIIVRGTQTLPFQYIQDITPETPPVRIVKHTTYTVETATPVVNPEWTFDKK